MPAGKKNLVVEQGATFDPLFTWYTQNDAGVRTPVDLTGYSAKAQFRDDFGGAVALDLTSADGSIVLGDALGTIQFLVADTVTGAVTLEGGVWDLELTAPSGKVTRLLQGKWKLSLEATE